MFLGLSLSTLACGGKKVEPLVYDADETGTLLIAVSGLHSLDGQMRMALYASSDGFPKDPEKAKSIEIKNIEVDPVEFVVPTLTYGRYAVSVLHDENANGKMESDWLGRPKEGYGVSRDARGSFGPPSFEDSMFDVKSDTVSIAIQLDYL